MINDMEIPGLKTVSPIQARFPSSESQGIVSSLRGSALKCIQLMEWWWNTLVASAPCRMHGSELVLASQ